MPGVERRGAWIVLGLGMLATAVALMIIGRHLSFFADEITFAELRRGWNLDTFLQPHNGHLVLVSVAVYKLLFVLVGLAHSWPYRLALILFDLACVALVYVLARRRLGAWPALFPAALLLLPGAARDDLLSAFQMAFVASLAFGLGALVCLDRRTRGGDVAAAALVTLSIASSGVGVAFALGILAELILARGAWRRLWVAIVPFALYGLWLLGYGDSNDSVMLSAVPQMPNFVAHIGAIGFAGFANLPVKAGGVLMLIVVAWLVAKIWRDRRVEPRAAVGIVGALCFWVLTALTRPDDPYASRYIYVSLVFIVLAVVFELPPSPRLSRRLGVVLAAVVAVAIVLGFSEFGQYLDYRHEADGIQKAQATAAMIGAPPGTPTVVAYRELDYDAPSARELSAMEEPFRRVADQRLIEYEGIIAVPSSVPGVCARSASRHGPGPTTVTVPPGRRLILLSRGAEPISVRLRRFAAGFQEQPLVRAPTTGATGQAATLVTIPTDHSSRPWHALIHSAAPVRVCVL